MLNLRFIYVARNDEWRERLREEWLYIYSMARFYQWWLGRNFHLHYKVHSDVLVVVKARLMALRFGMSDLIKHHREKGEQDYHFYLSYFKPRISDCSAGFFTDNFGLIRWKNCEGRSERDKFLALENCTCVSHMLLHEMKRQKGYGKEYDDLIHDQWDRHLYGGEEFDFYDRHYHKVSGEDDFMFATMKVPRKAGGIITG